MRTHVLKIARALSGDSLDTGALDAVIQIVSSPSKGSPSKSLALRGIKEHIRGAHQEEDNSEEATMTADQATRCARAFEALKYFEDKGISTKYLFRDTSELEPFAKTINLVLDGVDHGAAIRKAAALYLDLPVIASVSAENGIDISEVGVSFGTLDGAEQMTPDRK